MILTVKFTDDISEFVPIIDPLVTTVALRGLLLVNI
jgi:hypothetical protein